MPAFDGAAPFGAIPQNVWTTGTIFFVDSVTGSDAHAGTSKELPKATTEAAIANCTANKGDVVYLLPGHTEEIAANDISVNVAGVTIMGLGSGNAGATFNAAATGSTFSLEASSCRLSNVVFDLEGTATTVTSGVTITAAGDGCVVDHCKFQPHATSEFTTMIAVTGAADDVEIVYNDIFCLAGVSSTAGINVNAAANRPVIMGNRIHGSFITAAINNTTAAMLESVVAYNYVRQVDADHAIESTVACTGVLAWNSIAGGAALAANLDPGAWHNIENYVVDAIDAHAVLVPALAST